MFLPNIFFAQQEILVAEALQLFPASSSRSLPSCIGSEYEYWRSFELCEALSRQSSRPISCSFWLLEHRFGWCLFKAPAANARDGLWFAPSAQ
jgi:hypothetical protein